MNIFAKNYDLEILATLRELNPEMADMIFKGAHFERIPNHSGDKKYGGGYPIYASQAGDVTCLAWHHKDGTWTVQITCW